MVKSGWILILLVLLFRPGFSQVTTDPSFPTENQPVKVIFDSSKESRLGYYTGDLYAHTGVIIEGDTEWKHVIGSWGDNSVQPKLTNKGNGIYELLISPDIRSYYSVLANEKVIKLAFVFRSGDGAKQTNDLFTDVYEGSFSFKIIEPEGTEVVAKNQDIPFSASASGEAALKLYSNNNEIKSITGTGITHTFNFAESGDYWLKATATTNDTTIADSVFVHVKSEQVEAALPQNVEAGINIIDSQTVTLVLYAPGKESVFVIGDFNDWLPKNDFRMKKDGGNYWVTLENLTPGEEYAFQYFVDENIRIADPYTEKILDPWDDQYISNDVYPNLKAYPEGKTNWRVSTFQTGQTPYSWQTTSYAIPLKEDLVIYELLIRGFTEKGTYNAILEKLDYLEGLGVNAIELMPFNEFEGNSSWGYNPDFYFAPDKAYGTKKDLKGLIDECHKRGFIVIQDMVLNHAYNSCPLVKLYWDSANNRPAADNPWFNQASPNTAFSWGSDFNHESQATKDFVDRVTKFWMEEYKVDGFRFDFTKGFTNTPGDGSGYDASRIAILKRMADKVWGVNPEVFVILEHFTANQEEKELVAYKKGMLVWGNANYNFCEASMGYNESGKSDFSWASYQTHGFTQPGLVAYMESHDEERMMYKNITFGKSVSGYNVKDLTTALHRSGLAATFFFSLTGPKMIWQFGELGYDYSIDYNGRTGEKPVRWDYIENPYRQKLFDVYSAMIKLRQKFGVFTSGVETLNVNGALKSIHLAKNDTNIVVLGNFDVTTASIIPNFQHTGVWYEFFSEQTLNVTSVNTPISLQPGEYRLYSNKPLPSYTELVTSSAVISDTNEWGVYPSPASQQITVSSRNPIDRISIFSIYGNAVFTQKNLHKNQVTIEVNNYPAGIYFVQIVQRGGRNSKKIIIK